MTPILLDFARKSGFTLCKEESALREMLEQFAKFIIEHEAAKQPDYELIAWATTVGSHAHVSWEKDRPDYPIRYEVPIYTTPPAAPVQEPSFSEGWERRNVIGFDALVEALDYAERKGFMPDYIADAWEGFNYLVDEKHTPPAAQRQWVGLTDEEIYEMADDAVFLGNVKEITRAIEAKLKELNT